MCNADVCSLLLPPGASRVRLCFIGLETKQSTPQIETASERKVALAQDAKQRNRWCAAVDVSDAPFTLLDGKSRRLLSDWMQAIYVAPAIGGTTIPNTDDLTRHLLQLFRSDLQRDHRAPENPSTAVRSGRISAPISHLGSNTHAPTIGTANKDPQVAPPDRRKEPIQPGPLPAPVPPRARRPSPLPDDASFLDIVGLGASDRFHCSGVLVAPDLVLTAAHCLPVTRVAVGSYLADPIVELSVIAEVRHPILDAAVLRLARAIPVPVRARRTASDHAEPRGTMRLVGFGVDAPRTLAGFGIKRRLDLDVNSWGCDLARSAATGCQRGTEMVVAGIAGRDTCLGDSGGPVLELQEDSLRLVAITSRPVASGGARCGRGGIYVRVDALDTWLTTIQQETTP